MRHAYLPRAIRNMWSFLRVQGESPLPLNWRLACLDKIIIHSLDQQPNPTARLNSKWSFSITHPFTLLPHAHILLIRFFLSLSHEPDHSGLITVWNTAQPAWRLMQQSIKKVSSLSKILDASYIRRDQRNWGKMTCC